MLIGKKSAVRVAATTDANEIQAILQDEVNSAFKAAEAEIKATKR